MLRLALRWTTAIALGLLLLAGTALPMLSRMTCLMSGYSELRIGQPQDCCPPDDPCGEEEVDATCCVFQQVMPLEESCVPTSVAPELVPPLMSLGHPVPTRRLADEQVATKPCTKGPPLSASERLSRLQLLRA
jgi:hypothetical protein